MDPLVRARRLLLIGALVACSPAKREPVGVSNGGAIDHERAQDAAPAAPPLAGLPPDFRTTWNRIGSRITSEHGTFTADVYETGRARYAEDLFLRDASAGVYLLERTDAGPRFAVADPSGRTVADSDGVDGSAAGGTSQLGSVEPCVRCHSGARAGAAGQDWVFDVHQ